MVFPEVAKLLGFLLQVQDELDMCVLERACWCRCRVPLQGAAAGCRCRVSLQVSLLGAAECFFRVLLSECCAVMKLGCWCCCRGWLRDVCGSVGVRP